jgi:hypothetical protein
MPVKNMKLVTAAKKLLKLFGPKGEHWTRRSDARDANGDEVPVKSRKAVQWCLGGATEKLNLPSLVRGELRQAVPTASVVGFNDSHRTYTHVRKFLEKIVNRKELKTKS